MEIELPSFLKSHLLFDYHIQEQLEMWETLGGIDEQSIESTHPVFNELVRRYGCLRGRHLKTQIMKQFLLERANLILESIDEMVDETSRTKRTVHAKRIQPMGGMVDNEAAANVAAPTFIPISMVEESMNQNHALHPDAEELKQLDGFDDVHKRLGDFEREDTCIVVCNGCGKRILKLGMNIHQHEFHSGLISGDVNSDVFERMKVEAAM